PLCVTGGLPLQALAGARSPDRAPLRDRRSPSFRGDLRSTPRGTVGRPCPNGGSPVGLSPTTGEPASLRTNERTARSVKQLNGGPAYDAGMNPTHDTYRQRILKVQLHIQEHLDEDLSLERLARIAHFSPFHFHRIFSALAGESVHEYVRRLRLEA